LQDEIENIKKGKKKGKRNRKGKERMVTLKNLSFKIILRNHKELNTANRLKDNI